MALLGFFIWLLLISIAETIQAYGWHLAYNFVSGYVMGFLVAFSGSVFWEIVFGRIERFLYSHPYIRWSSYLVVAITLLAGIVGLFVQIFGNTDWRYSIGALVGALVFSIGLLPVIRHYDRAR